MKNLFLLSLTLIIISCNNNEDVDLPNYTLDVPEFTELIGTWKMDSAMYEFEDTNWNLTSNELCELRPNQASQQQSWFFYQDLTVYYDNEEKINRFEHIRCGMEQSGVIERNVDDPTKFEGLWDDHYTWGYKVQILNVSENRLTLGFDDELWTVFYSKE